MLRRDRVCGREAGGVNDVALGQVKDYAATGLAWFPLAVWRTWPWGRVG
jgi:hypothetical protein